MRALVIFAIATLVGTAHADQKIVSMTPLFVKESTACEVQASGLAKLATGATTLAAAHAEDAQLQADATRLAAGLEQMRTYCAEVAAMVTLLRDNAKTAYRAIEKEIDARDNKIRKQRREAKRLAAELSPISRRLIPRLAATRTAAPAREKLVASKFPSGRVVELPVLGGTWKLSGTANVDTADYSDKALTASVTARAKLASTCDKHRIALEKTEGIEQLVDAEIPAGATADGIVWRITYTRRDKATGVRHHEEVCAEHGGVAHGVAAYAVPASVALPGAIVGLMIRMLVAQTPRQRPADVP